MPDHRLTLAEVVMNENNGLETVLDYIDQSVSKMDEEMEDSLENHPLEWAHHIHRRDIFLEFKRMIGRAVESAAMDSKYRAKLIAWATNPEEDD